MCAPTIPRPILQEKLRLIMERDVYADFLGSFNVRLPNNQVIFGTGVRGNISKNQGLIAWANSEKGEAALKQQASDRGTEYLVHRATTVTRFQRELLAAQKDQKAYTKALANVELQLASIESATPELGRMSREDIEHLLGVESGDDTNVPAARLATEAGTQEASDVALEAILNSHS